ncbi:MAG: hypothetical protein SPK00_12285 [Corynebacterium glucuronolyticum]|nr:hypothetical protein [Mycobacteriaceae bacterium]MDY5835496.1 hypothetical protein [Corynebacterium glucuronolyticum]
MLDDEELLIHIGVVTPEGALTDVGVYALAPTTAPRFCVNGRCIGGHCMIDQLAQVEEILSDLNAPVGWGVGGLSISASPIPESAVRNALIANKSPYAGDPIEGQRPRLRVRLQRAREPRPVGSPPCAGATLPGQSGYPIDSREIITRGLRAPSYSETRICLFGGEPDWNGVRSMREIRPGRLIGNELAVRAVGVLFDKTYVSTRTLADQLGIDGEIEDDVARRRRW